MTIPMMLISNTNFSIHFVVDKIRPDIKEFRDKSTEWLVANQLESFQAEDITGGAAFMSSILRLTLNWKQPNGGGLPSSVVMKIPGPKYNELKKGQLKEQQGKTEKEREEEDPMEEETCQFLAIAHKLEIAFYQYFPSLDPTLRVPKFYFGSDYNRHNNNGLILMEDLSPRAVTMPVLPGFDEPHLLAILDEIARVHVVSWKHPEWEKHLGPSHIRVEFINAMRFKAEELAKIEPNHLGPLIRRLQPMFTADYCAMAGYSGTKYGFPSCLVHADLWAPNILWDKDPATGSATDRLCALIDWQCLHPGNPCEDISRLLSLHTTDCYRRENTDRLLAYYAQKVAERMGPDEGKVPFTMEQLRDAYKHSLPFTMMMMCFGASVYYYMDSVVGREPDERPAKRAELLRRVTAFLEDTTAAFDF